MQQFKADRVLIQQILKSTKNIIKQLPTDGSILNGMQDMLILASSYRHVFKKSFVKSLDSPELSLKFFLDCFKTTQQNTLSRKFKSKKWQHPPFCYYKNTYENFNSNLLSYINQLSGISSFDRKQLQLFIHVFFECIAPYNHLIFHPELLALTKKQKGKNLLQGFANFLSDLDTWQGYFAITRSPLDSFKPGQNIALTPGHVINKTPLYELIVYPAQHDKQIGTPLLLVTSWINKYYILDLKKRNSFINWLTTNGFHVYIISWNMPDENFCAYGFNDYVEKGVLEVIETLYSLYKTPLHVAGYCLGGTLLASAVAYLAKKHSQKIKTLSLFASMLDFEHAGQMKYLLGEAQINAFENSMKNACLWHGRKMAAAFCLADSDNVYWPFYRRNYIQGETPIAHELIYWAQDYTHSPQQLFTDYMRILYQENALIIPGKILIHGKSINFNQINQAVYCVAIKEDNLTPAQAAFKTAKLFPNCRFILSDGTHVSGMLNTPQQKKLGFYTQQTKNNIQQLSLSEWQSIADYQKGSWWLDWLSWMKHQSLKAVSLPSNQNYLYPAPGEYVLKSFIET